MASRKARLPLWAMVPTFFHLVVGHADAVVLHRDGPLLPVRGDPDPELGVLAQDAGIGLGAEPDLVDGVRGIRDELSEEDLGVRVQGVDDELQDLLYFRLELVRLLLVLHGFSIFLYYE